MNVADVLECLEWALEPGLFPRGGAVGSDPDPLYLESFTNDLD